MRGRAYESDVPPCPRLETLTGYVSLVTPPERRDAINAHNYLSLFGRRNAVALLFALSFSLVALCGLTYSRAQEAGKGEREVVEKIAKHLPIKFKVKKPEKLKDAENEDWLGDLEVEVTNTGTKPIYYLNISVYLPEVAAPSGNSYGFGLKYGRGALISLSEPVTREDVPIHPGGVVVLRVHENVVEAWRSLRARGERTNPKKIEFRFNYLNFGDGTDFVGGVEKSLTGTRERGANATCPVGDGNAVGAASVEYPPRSYFPDIASLAPTSRRRPTLCRPFFLVDQLHPPRRRGRTPAARPPALG